MSPRLPSMVLAAVLAAALTAAHAQDEAPVELEPMQVGPREDPLWSDRERLRKLVEDQPCLGCDVAVRRGWRSAIADFVMARATPPNPDAEARREMRLAEDWRAAERGPEMEAFR